MSLERPIDGDWLLARREADSRARELALPLVTRLAAELVAGTGPERPREVWLVDLGAGTGANPAWLAPHLDRALLRADDPETSGTGPPQGDGWRQHWVLLDHDDALLARVDLEQPAAPAGPVVIRVVGTVGDLSTVLAGLPRPLVVTCSALLDLLSPADLDTLAGTVAASADAALLCLSVTGGVRFDPADEGDGVLQAAFDRHQRRVAHAGAHLSGPDGAGLAAAALTGHGLQVHRADTPWRLGPAESPMLHRWLRERVAAALEGLDAEGAQHRAVSAWWRRRADQISHGDLSVQVDHLDLLAHPDR